MPINIAWDDESQTTLLITYVEPWDWDEFYRSAEQANALIGSMPYPVNLLIDLQDNWTMPLNVLAHLRRLLRLAHPNTGAVVIVGANTVWQILMDVYVRVYGQSERQSAIVKTLEEGRQFLTRESC